MRVTLLGCLSGDTYANGTAPRVGGGYGDAIWRAYPILDQTVDEILEGDPSFELQGRSTREELRVIVYPKEWQVIRSQAAATSARTGWQLFRQAPPGESER